MRGERSTSSLPSLLSHAAGVSTSHWPFPSSVDVSSSHAAFISLLSHLTDTPVDVVSQHEAALLETHAVASLHDLMDLYADKPPSEYDTERQRERRELSIHIVSTGQQAALEAQLEQHGYSGWTSHARWTTERMIEQRHKAAQYMFPAINSIHTDSNDGNPSMGNDSVVDDGADIDSWRLNYMDHVDVLLNISASSLLPLSSSRLSLVLESDAVLTPFFRQRMDWVAQNVPDNFTAVFFAGCLNLHVGLDQLPSTLSESTSSTSCSSVTDTGVIMSCSAPPQRPTPLLIPSIRSRCTSGYLVSALSASRILSAVQRVTRTQTAFVPISHTFNEAFDLLSRPTGNSTVYQMEPPAAYERSKILQVTTTSDRPVPAIRAVNYTKPVQLVSIPPPPSRLPHSASSPVRSTAQCELSCSWQRSLTAPILSRVNSNSGADWSSYIAPTTFRDMADWVYWRHKEVLSPNDPLIGVNETVAIDCLTAGALIYVQSTMLVKFFNEVHPNIKQPYFLITGSADTTTPGGWVHHLDSNEDGSPSMLMHWFAQNGNSSHPHFTTIPIGIPFPMADALDLTLHGQNSLVVGDMYDEDRLSEGSELADGGSSGASQSKRYHPRIEQFRWDNPGDFDEQKWLLVNFDVNTNPSERELALGAMCGNSSAGVEAVPFAECVEKKHGTSQYYSSMRAIYHRNSRYRFTLSPPGNGMDCHRTWEAIYLGVVPIVKSGPLDDLFVDLPVLVVDEWDQLTVEVLSSQWDAISTKYHGTVLEKLHFRYWRRVIVDTAMAEMRVKGVTVDGTWTDLTAPRRRCWGRVDK